MYSQGRKSIFMGFYSTFKLWLARRTFFFETGNRDDINSDTRLNTLKTSQVQGSTTPGSDSLSRNLEGWKSIVFGNA